MYVRTLLRFQSGRTAKHWINLLRLAWRNGRCRMPAAWSEGQARRAQSLADIEIIDRLLTCVFSVSNVDTRILRMNDLNHGERSLSRKVAPLTSASS